ncbi:MAG: YitT family protein [Coriobacteriia bacterium]
MVREKLAAIAGHRVLRHRRVRDYAWMTAGILLTAWALDAFLIPNRLAAGGVSGLATVFHYVALQHGLELPVGVQMLVMNVGLLALAVRVRGWRYGAKTVYGAVGLSLAVDLLAPFTPHLAANDNLLAVLWGGALTGIGMGLVFKAGGNTGGTDIIAQLLTRRVSLGLGQLMLLVDAVVTVCAAIVFGPTLALYGAVAVFINGSVIDVVQEGLSVEKAAYIISDHSDRIAQAILEELGRGATGLLGRGLYSGQQREVIFTVVSRKELDDLKSLVRAVDPKAFLIISDVHEVLGEGFKENGV